MPLRLVVEDGIRHALIHLNWPVETVAEFFRVKSHSVLRIRNSIGQESHERRGRRTKVSEHDRAFIRNLVEENNIIYLDEVRRALREARGTLLSVPTISRVMKNLGFRHKKLELMAKEASRVRQADYVLRVARFHSYQLIFLDEVHANSRNLERKYGWAMGSRRPRKSGHYMRRQKYSTIAAITQNGMFAYWTKTGGCKAECFKQFIEKFVLPKMNRYPGPDSVLVLDNSSIHNLQLLRQLARQYQIKFIFLPPYSPTFNPIELSFSKFKAELRRLGGQPGADATPALILIREAIRTISPSDCEGYVRHCGYRIEKY